MSGTLQAATSQARSQGLCGDWRRGPQLGAVMVSGADCPDFLQAQLTSDVLAVAPGQGQISARLNRQGQLLAWFSLHRLPDRGQPFPVFLLLLPHLEIAPLIADLGAFIISEDVVLDDMSTDFSGVVFQQPVPQENQSPLAEVVLGPCPSEVGDQWADLPENGLAFAALPDGGEAWVIRRALTGDPGFVVLQQGARSVGPGWQEAVAGREMLFLDDLSESLAQEAWRSLQAEAGWPRLGQDLDSGQRVLPQVGLEQQAVSYTKGCYLGQEVVARIRSYGSVPQALRAVIWQDWVTANGEPLPEVGSACESSTGEKLGTWAGTYWSAVRQKSISLVFLDRENRTPGSQLSIAVPAGEVVGEVALLPLHRAANASERAIQMHDRALVQFSEGRDNDAVAMLEEALRLDPTNADVFEALGVILGRLEKFHEAIDIFHRLEEVAPNEPMVHTNLSLFYMKIGQKDEAERQKALGTMKKFGVGSDPQQAAKMAEQERQMRREDAERKRAMFAEVLAFDADDGLALMGMGKALETLGESEAAADHLLRALDQQGGNSALYASCGQILEALARVEEAAEIYHRGIDVASRKGDLMPLREMEHRLRLLGH